MLKIQESILTSFKINPKKIGAWGNVPISNKSEIRKAEVPKTFAELRVTSGSTGNPLYVFYSKEAVHSFIQRTITSLRKSGLSKKDVVLNLFAYGNYVPGSMYEKACQMEEISVMPLGAPNTYSKDKVIEAILKVRPNVWLSVPSYAIALLDLLARDKQNKKYFPKKIIIAGERLYDAYVIKFKEYDVEIVNHFGLTECPAIGVSKKGNARIIEIINDGIHTESIERDGMKYFVVTDLNNTATPIIRYETGDIIDNVKFNKDSTLSEISIIGRADDLVKIQGVLISKTKIIEIISHFTDKFFVDIKTRDGRDFVEITLDHELKKAEAEIDSQLTFLKKREYIYKKQIIVPKTSSYKNKHIVDSR